VETPEHLSLPRGRKLNNPSVVILKFLRHLEKQAVTFCLDIITSNKLKDCQNQGEDNDWQPNDRRQMGPPVEGRTTLDPLPLYQINPCTFLSRPARLHVASHVKE
jgi:hypothetical protein